MLKAVFVARTRNYSEHDKFKKTCLTVLIGATELDGHPFGEASGPLNVAELIYVPGLTVPQMKRGTPKAAKNWYFAV